MNNVLHIIGKNIHDLTLDTCNDKHEDPSWLTFFTRRILVKDRGMIHVIPLADIAYLLRHNPTTPASVPFIGRY